MANFNGSEGGSIPLATAKQWTANYRATIKSGDTLAHYFGGDIIRRILSEDGCVGIRIYYAIDDKGKKQLLLVGTNANGDNLLPSSDSAKNSSLEGNDPIIGDLSYPCPNMCPANPL